VFTTTVMRHKECRFCVGITQFVLACAGEVSKATAK
jgi:hypothetical protein